MGKLHDCQPVELVFVDPARFLRLSRERGARSAEAIASVAVEEIVMRMRSVEAAWQTGEFTRLGKVARSLVGLSREIGLSSVADVATLVAEEAHSGDAAALGALVARLSRVTNASVSKMVTTPVCTLCSLANGNSLLINPVKP